MNEKARKCVPGLCEGRGTHDSKAPSKLAEKVISVYTHGPYPSVTTRIRSMKDDSVVSEPSQVNQPESYGMLTFHNIEPK